jgi:hypothetical protein
MSNAGDSVILETTDTEGARLAFAADNAKLWFMLRPPVGATNSKPGLISEASLADASQADAASGTADSGSVPINGQQQETP